MDNVRLTVIIPITDALTLKRLADLHDREFRAQARAMLRRAIKTAGKKLTGAPKTAAHPQPQPEAPC